MGQPTGSVQFLGREVEQRWRRSWIDLVFEKPCLANQQRANTTCPVSRSLSSRKVNGPGTPAVAVLSALVLVHTVPMTSVRRPGLQ
jgi:hypothetical protein